MLKIWIAGSAGQIGTAINEVLDPLEMEVFNTDKDELDITQTDEVFWCPACTCPAVFCYISGTFKRIYRTESVQIYKKILPGYGVCIFNSNIQCDHSAFHRYAV